MGIEVTTMEPDLSWLPELIELEAYDGDWHEYVEVIYEAFCQDFVDYPRPSLNGVPFRLKAHPYFQDKEATFWHVTSEGKVEEDRSPDLRRCERIRWPLAMIQAVGTERVLTWENTRKGKRRLVIALPDFSYVTIVELKKGYNLLWTAYLIKYENERAGLQREYEAYLEAQK